MLATSAFLLMACWRAMLFSEPCVDSCKPLLLPLLSGSRKRDLFNEARLGGYVSYLWMSHKHITHFSSDVSLGFKPDARNMRRNSQKLPTSLPSKNIKVAAQQQGLGYLNMCHASTPSLKYTSMSYRRAEQDSRTAGRGPTRSGGAGQP